MAPAATKHLAHELVPSRLNLLSLHMGVPGIHSGQAPCPHAYVCPEPAALLSSLRSGLPQFHVSLNVAELELQLLPVSQLTLHFLLFILPSPGSIPDTESTPARCDVPPCFLMAAQPCGVWRGSHSSPFTFCVSDLPLGNTALNERGLDTGMTSS